MLTELRLQELPNRPQLLFHSLGDRLGEEQCFLLPLWAEEKRNRVRGYKSCFRPHRGSAVWNALGSRHRGLKWRSESDGPLCSSSKAPLSADCVVEQTEGNVYGINVTR